MLAAALVGLLFAPTERDRIEAAVEALAEAFELLDVDPRIQAQLVGLTAMPDAERLGSAEVEYNQSMWSVGSALAVGYEHTSSTSLGSLDGGFLRAELQWRFLALAHRTFHQWLDPHLDAGLLLGGLSDGDDSWFRAAGYFGGGFDLRFLPTRRHVVLTMRYRYSPETLQLPDGLPEHMFVVGLGVRIAY